MFRFITKKELDGVLIEKSYGNSSILPVIPNPNTVSIRNYKSYIIYIIDN